MKTVLLYILLITAFFSCDNEQKEKEKQILQLVNEWQGKQIVFPENTVFTRYLTDTTNYQIPQSEYKVLIYVDSIGCTSCKLQLHKWQELDVYKRQALYTVHLFETSYSNLRLIYIKRIKHIYVLFV